MIDPPGSLGGIRILLSRQRRLRAAAGAVRTFCILASIHLLALAALGLVSLRFPLSPIPLSLMAWSYAIYVLIPALYWFRLSSQSNSAGIVARDLDRANPSAPDPFRTSLSLGNHDAETLRQLDRILSPVLPGLHLPRPVYLPRSHLLILAAGLLAICVSAFASGRPWELIRRAAGPWAALDRLPTLRFELPAVIPVLGAGDTARVRGMVTGMVPGQPVFAYVRSASGVSRYPLAVDSGRTFAFAFGPAEADFVLYFAGENGRSAALRYRVLPPPVPARIQAVLHPPAYTRLHPDTLPAGVMRFPVLPGTRVEWNLEADRDLKRMAWNFGPADSSGPGDSARAAVRSDTSGPGRRFRAEKKIRIPTAYSFWLEDGMGIRSTPFAPYRVDLIPDLAPEVELASPANDTVLDRDARLALAFRVKDDYGVASLSLVYKVLTGGKIRSQGKRDARDWLRSARAGLVETEWDMTGLGVRQDDVVEFHLAAVDNDTVNGPKTGRSATRFLRMPSRDEALAAARKSERNAEAGLKSALQREKQLERKLEREKQAPQDENGPPMLAEYEINRVMVDDPRDHLHRTEATLERLEQSLARSAKERGGRDGDPDKAGSEIPQARQAARELDAFLEKSEASLPSGNQNRIPAEERRKNLEELIRSQKEQASKLAALREKLEKAPRDQGALDQSRKLTAELAQELEKNIRNQDDLKKFMQDEASQAKAKSDFMDQAIQEQMRMAEDMKGASDELDKAMAQGKKNGLLSPELMEKMKKVQDLLKEVLPDSLRRMMESKMQGQEVDEKELREKLKEMLDKQAELSENLNRAMAMLEQMKDRKRMDELKGALQELESREKALEKRLAAGQAGAPEESEQASIQQETRKAMSDFSAQAQARKGLRETDEKLKRSQVQKDMQDVRKALAEAQKEKGKQDPSSATAASKSAAAAAAKLAEMGDMLGSAMQGMENSVDLEEARDLLQESLALARLQLLIRSGSARRKAEGWEPEEAALYGSVAQTAQWINERAKALAAQAPFLGAGLTTEARGLAAASREASRQYTWDTAEKSLKHNQNLSRELLKLLKMAQSGGGGSGSGSPGGSPGQGGGGQGGDLSGQLQGMSGKQMAINQATYQLLQAMMEGRDPGRSGGKPGGKPRGGKPGGGKGGESAGGEGTESGQAGSAGSDGEGSGTDGAGEGDSPGGEGSLGGMANKQGELGESLESLAEGLGEEGGPARKLRGLAEEARRLEEDLRQGRINPEELRRRQERFQTRLLEASNAMQERGQSEKREAEAGRGRPMGEADRGVPAETRLMELLREARRNAKGLRLSEGQRKYLDEFYESLLTR